MKNIKLLVYCCFGLCLCGCVHNKYGIHSDGTQIQVGSYIQNRDIYTSYHFIWTKKGKMIKEMNAAVEEYYRTNKIGMRK